MHETIRIVRAFNKSYSFAVNRVGCFWCIHFSLLCSFRLQEERATMWLFKKATIVPLRLLWLTLWFKYVFCYIARIEERESLGRISVQRHDYCINSIPYYVASLQPRWSNLKRLDRVLVSPGRLWMDLLSKSKVFSSKPLLQENSEGILSLANRVWSSNFATFRP